ncbi:hypothetical protein Dda_7115 [Drechslerella dactyloides]|uniref:Uncharacterized protein n=1 Tax=Drechslerella dactyloides TaxID=74499 RepID=A0AAD6IWV5_DREDA|nr:hypothetical protein Dda_7115 [Drechslerella dactyloides]
MSWTEIREPYSEFQNGPSDPWQNPRFLRPLDSSVDIWEMSKSHPEGTWYEGIIDFRHFYQADGSYKLRIMQVQVLPTIVPEKSDFLNFGTRKNRDGSSCTWFHFLCKNLDVDRSGPLPRIENRVKLSPAILQSYRHSNRLRKASLEMVDLPQADFSWLRSGFFLKTESADRGKGTTLACFGATPYVRKRLEMWIENRRWDTITEEPLSFLDLVMEGLFQEVDNTIWKMADVFGPMETSILKVARVGFPALEQKVEFIGLHHCLKHTIYLSEAIESCLFIVDGIKSATQTTLVSSAAMETSSLLLASLSHWRTLFTSTSLRLSSLHRRVENLTGLCFNLVTQQDSMILRHESMTMRQDASAMKVLASITVVFLPTMAVASILGSQLFVTVPKEDGNENGYFQVKISPLFNVLWMCSIPMTFLVIALAAAWSWYSHSTYPKTSDQMKERLDNDQKFLPRWVLTLRNVGDKVRIV